MKKKELLKEVMGVPKVLNPWIKSFTKVIINDFKKQNNWHDEGPVNYKNSEGEMVEDTALRMVDLEIPGKEVMEEMYGSHNSMFLNHTPGNHGDNDGS